MTRTFDGAVFIMSDDQAIIFRPPERLFEGNIASCTAQLSVAERENGPVERHFES